MAEDSDLEKTEQPSSRRLEQAREEGQVPQSRELSTFLVLIAGIGALWMMGEWMSGRILGMLRAGFAIERARAFDPKLMLESFGALFTDALLTMLPLFGVLMVAAIAAPVLMGGFVFAPKMLGLKLERMNPIQGIGRMFSMHGVAELVKSVLKAAVVGLMGVFAVWREHEHIFGLTGEAVEAAVPDFLEMVLFATVLIIMGLAILALIDVPFQLWQYNKKLRMTKEEVKRESKEQEGDPQVKGRIRAMQREMARRRMMTQVPKADVVVTNPTHFSVALKYDADKMRAPIVVAKGRGELALKIRELAKEHKVPMLEAPPLARALYKHCELEQAVPGALYTAVAEVMAYVYQLNHWMAHGGLPPAAPGKLPVPADMDPGAPD
ncbi:flagellar type III secretion system protein FlhB [Aromatoleum toluclasticum]|uniref:flagellar biosynthesis protein FlhB n=1 Tax=Aromatoleum toluclasticum TaxID=92003 RepID=UPI000380425F|nr:flagellar biosynthesis protein FlhB [Aromatoleum toluclasticum]MCC4115296.1 flagellar type III secretion system protein FlhB [Aromatoleum toluclasticum]